MNNVKDISDVGDAADLTMTMQQAVRAYGRERPVAICGLGPGCEDTPEGWEIWACAWGIMAARADVLFDCHDERWWQRYGQSAEALAEYCLPVYLLHEHEKVPMSRAFDRPALFECVRERPQSNVGWMMSQAIMDKRDFGLFGVDMLSDSDYRYQRPNCRYLKGLAEGRGLRVTIPSDSGLHDGRPAYGEEWIGADVPEPQRGA